MPSRRNAVVSWIPIVAAASSHSSLVLIVQWLIPLQMPSAVTYVGVVVAVVVVVVW